MKHYLNSYIIMIQESKRDLYIERVCVRERERAKDRAMTRLSLYTKKFDSSLLSLYVRNKIYTLEFVSLES